MAFKDSPHYYHEVLKRIPPRALPAFEAPEMQERVWGRRWGVYDDIGALKVCLVHRPGDEIRVMTGDRYDPAIEALIDDDAQWYFRSDRAPDLKKMQAEHDRMTRALRDEGVEAVEIGEEGAYEAGVHGLHPELVKLIGRMNWRTSYGQNILQHSKEVAWLAGIMAAELGLDVAMAKRGALLHDIGKVLTHEHEGTHVQLGVEVATKYGEHPLVVNCIAAHHDDVPHESEISVLVQAADAISGSRPGARREAFETYVKRLEGLERIASSYKGVERTFAIQAGREVRVIVVPDEVDDPRMASMSEEIARRIEAELQYPGQIKVVLIRETRAVDFAR